MNHHNIINKKLNSINNSTNSENHFVDVLLY